MVVGLERFRAHFAGLGDRYVLIGGVATQLALEAAGVAFRPTKDLDIVLMAEALDAVFMLRFWQFVHDGRYDERTYSSADNEPQPRRTLYRFRTPQVPDYPAMLELFARQPLDNPPQGHLTRIAAHDEGSSLSAILLLPDYYRVILDHREVRDGLPVVRPEGLIPLKAKAWLDLSERRARGEPVDGRTVRKHATDVLRLAQLLTPAQRVSTEESVQVDLAQFRTAAPPTLGEVTTLEGIGRVEVTTTMALLARVYGL